MLFFKTVDKVYKYRIALERDLDQRSEEELKHLLVPAKVMAGLNKGLDYNGIEAHGSQYYPKLIGSYEEPIQPKIKALIDNKPDLIVDIGCAEGYYAVGMACQLKKSDSRVLAIDTDSDAIEECLKLSKLNGVENVIELHNLFDNKIEARIQSANNPFILCDCEGCEKSLFNSTSIKLFRHCTLLIELHDFIIPSVEKQLIEIFSDSHSVEIIEDSTRNLKQYTFLKGLKYYTKQLAINEKRPVKMKWLWAKPI